jgi:hypothetical protein
MMTNSLAKPLSNIPLLPMEPFRSIRCIDVSYCLKIRLSSSNLQCYLDLPLNSPPSQRHHAAILVTTTTLVFPSHQDIV